MATSSSLSVLNINSDNDNKSVLFQQQLYCNCGGTVIARGSRLLGNNNNSTKYACGGSTTIALGRSFRKVISNIMEEFQQLLVFGH